MPHTKSSRKRLITSGKAHARNAPVRSRFRTAIKKVRQASNREEAEKALHAAISIIDRTAKKGIIHRNTAARHKSRLSKLVRSMEA